MRDVESLLKLINHERGMSFELAGRFEGGEQGAHEIVGTYGTRMALKLHHGAGYLERYRKAKIATEHLAERGYPVPRYEYIGVVGETSYTIQSLVPGSPMGTLNASVVPDLLRLIDLQSGPAPFPSRGWPQLIVHSVMHGFDEYCVIETLRRHSATTSEILDLLQSQVSTCANIDVETTDIVHFDFNPSNVMVHQSGVSGVIDWDGVMAGDRAFDLATLFFYASDDPALRQLLWREGLARSSPDAMRLYIAHLIVRQVDWSIRFHSPAIADYWISAVRRLADEVM